MGLAISIVAHTGYPERVWYHKCKDRGKGCKNRKLVEKGGCTMWLDESLALQAVEKRLGNSVPELQADFSLPKEIAELGTVYGEEAHAVGGRREPAPRDAWAHQSRS